MDWCVWKSIAFPISLLQLKMSTTRINEFIASVVDDRIVLLRNPEVVQWICGDLSFLPPIVKKNKTHDTHALKLLEDVWGRAALKVRRPDLALDKQWTNLFGECLCQEIYVLLGKETTKPTQKNRFRPDWETEDAIVEVKAETFFTEGTAGEKILGVPFKYAEVPDLYSKPLKILCIGGAEKSCREQYGVLPGLVNSPQKQRYIDFFRQNMVEFVGATDLLRSLVGL